MEVNDEVYRNAPLGDCEVGVPYGWHGGGMVL